VRPVKQEIYIDLTNDDSIVANHSSTNDSKKTKPSNLLKPAPSQSLVTSNDSVIIYEIDNNTLVKLDEKLGAENEKKLDAKEKKAEAKSNNNNEENVDMPECPICMENLNVVSSN
jgi:hypothetical protein